MLLLWTTNHIAVKQICRRFAVYRLVVHNNNIRSMGFLVGYDPKLHLRVPQLRRPHWDGWLRPASRTTLLNAHTKTEEGEERCNGQTHSHNVFLRGVSHGLCPPEREDAWTLQLWTSHRHRVLNMIHPSNNASRQSERGRRKSRFPLSVWQWLTQQRRHNFTFKRRMKEQ